MAAVGTRYYTPNALEFDGNGVPLAGGRLFFYLTGTTTPLNTYNDVALTTPNPNPVVANANGRFGSIFLVPSQAYNVQLWTAATALDPVGSQIWSFDPVGPAAGGAVSSSAGIIGEVRMFAGPSSAVPAQWYLCYGQAISRSTYASLFAVIGTAWGAGDGSTTFNLPDLRGRSLFGQDNMGGVPANRLTSGVSGVAWHKHWRHRRRSELSDRQPHVHLDFDGNRPRSYPSRSGDRHGVVRLEHDWHKRGNDRDHVRGDRYHGRDDDDDDKRPYRRVAERATGRCREHDDLRRRMRQKEHKIGRSLGTIRVDVDRHCGGRPDRCPFRFHACPDRSVSQGGTRGHGRLAD